MRPISDAHLHEGSQLGVVAHGAICTADVNAAGPRDSPGPKGVNPQVSAAHLLSKRIAALRSDSGAIKRRLAGRCDPQSGNVRAVCAWQRITKPASCHDCSNTRMVMRCPIYEPFCI